MSTVKADYLVNAAGTGAPTFSNGIISNGNVGIGTSSPSTYGNLAIFGKTYSSTGYALTSDSSNFTPSGVTNSIPNYGLGAPETSVVSLSGFESLRFYTNQAECARIDNSGNFKFNSGYGSVATAYGCRAWVNFNGIGTVAILASGNVTSITDGGTGTFAINFTTAMPDANYTLVGNVDGNSRVMSMNSLAAGAANIQTRYTPSNVLQDCGINTAAIFR